MIKESQIRARLKELCEAESNAEIARRLNVSRQFIGDVLAGKRKVSARIAAHFGYEKQAAEREFAALKK